MSEKESVSLLINASHSSSGSSANPPPRYSEMRRRNILEHLKTSYTWKSLFTVKPIQAFLDSREARKKGNSLAEKLGLIDLLGYGVGCTVGAGIYSLIGVGAGIAGRSRTSVQILIMYDC